MEEELTSMGLSRKVYFHQTLSLLQFLALLHAKLKLTLCWVKFSFSVGDDGLLFQVFDLTEINVYILSVIHEGGVVSSLAFQLMTDWALSFVQSYTISPTDVMVGLVYFATTSRTLIDVSSDKVAIENAIST